MGKSKQKAQKVETAPWAPAQQYLLSNAKKGTLGVLPEASDLYRQYETMPGLASGALENIQTILQRQGAEMPGQVAGINKFLSETAIPGLENMMMGRMLPQLDRVENVQGGDLYTDMTRARQAQGVLDPTQRLRRFMTGEIDTRYLDPQAQAISQQISRNTMENIMPGIRSGAIASGQYGGSRQGIAEGLAASRAQQDLAPALTNLYGTAFENAQNRAFGTATGLNQQAQQVAQQNAANEMARQQFNANLGLQRNQQAMQLHQARLGDIQAGADLYGKAIGMQDAMVNRQVQPFQQLYSLANMPQQYAQQNLQNYANLIYPAAGFGQSQQTPMTSNKAAGALGGAMSGAAMGSMLGGPMGMAIGGLGGGLMGLLG